MFKLLITGANGLLGQKLTELLQQDLEIQTIATARKKPMNLPERIEFLPLDITDREAVMATLLQARPDVVIHTAAMTQVDQCETEKELCWKSNVNAVEYLMEACKQTGAHLVHVSTDFIFDGSHGPLDENAQPAPVNYYGSSKWAAEKALQKSLIPHCILRTVLVYGIVPDLSRSNIVLWVKNNLENHKPIRVVNDQWRTPTLAEDLAIGCVLAAKKRATGIFNISGKDFMTPYDIAVQTAAHFHLDASLIQATDSNQFKQPAQRPLKTGFIIEKARKELGYEPRSFQEGLSLMEKQLHRYASIR